MKVNNLYKNRIVEKAGDNVFIMETFYGEVFKHNHFVKGEY